MSDRESIYVGYRPLPASNRRALRVLLPGLFVLLAAIAGVVALTQRPAGTGVWSTEQTTLEGIVTTTPAASLIIGSGENAHAVLLVQEGKRSAQRRCVDWEGKRVRVRGTTLQRDGITMLEIPSDDAAIIAADGPVVDTGAIAPRVPHVAWHEGHRTLTGEIVDAKCYLGAMRPGDGKAHKACATLCARNGIHTFFVTREDDRGAGYLLLPHSLNGDVLEMIGEPVRVEAQLGEWCGLQVLTVVGIQRTGTGLSARN